MRPPSDGGLKTTYNVLYRHGAIMLFCCTTIVQGIEVSKQVDVVYAPSSKTQKVKMQKKIVTKDPVVYSKSHGRTVIGHFLLRMLELMSSAISSAPFSKSPSIHLWWLGQSFIRDLSTILYCAEEI